MRDWAKEGAAERAQSYERICDEVKKWLPVKQGECYNLLVPGCGLGRLPYMLASLGYQTEVELEIYLPGQKNRNDMEMLSLQKIFGALID